MSLVVLVIGVIAQFMFAFFQLMMVAFSAASTFNNADPVGWRAFILNASIYILPLTSLVVGGLLIYFYRSHSPLLTNWWHMLPITLFISYMVFVTQQND